MFTDLTLYDFLFALWCTIGGYTAIHCMYATWVDWNNLK